MKLITTLDFSDRLSIFISDCAGWSSTFVDWGNCDDADGRGGRGLAGLAEEWMLWPGSELSGGKDALKLGTGAAVGNDLDGGSETRWLLWTRVGSWEPPLETWCGKSAPSFSRRFCNLEYIQWEEMQKAKTKMANTPPITPPNLPPVKPRLLWKVSAVNS